MPTRKPPSMQSIRNRIVRFAGQQYPEGVSTEEIYDKLRDARRHTVRTVLWQIVDDGALRAEAGHKDSRGNACKRYYYVQTICDGGPEERRVPVTALQAVLLGSILV